VSKPSKRKVPFAICVEIIALIVYYTRNETRFDREK